MENAAKALEMAAGVLLGVLILSLIAYFMTTVKSWPSQQEEDMTVEQLAAFNLEYEVFNKKMMYGTDVISCLNKIQNNNQKYVEGFGFFSGFRYSNFDINKNEYIYLINCYVNLKSDLEESLEVYALNKKLQEKQVFNIDDFNIANKSVTIGEMFSGNLEFFDKGFTTFEKTKTLSQLFSGNTKTSIVFSYGAMPGEYICGPTSGSYHGDTQNDDGVSNYYYSFYKLNGSNSLKINKPLGNLLAITDQMSISVKNVVASKDGDWSSAHLKTAAYSFKKKKFKCDKLEYNDETHRVSAIYFSEL